MKKIELNKRKTFYFLGICGISMSALAIFLKRKENLVFGSDVSCGQTQKLLDQEGIEVDLTLSEKKIEEADYVVCSSAIKENDEHFVVAKKLNKIILSRGELLGAISKEYEKVIAVAGSHGKTTTTAMIYEVLKQTGNNPTLHLGGFRCDDQKNFNIGGKKYFVTEACEYHDNFLNLHPYVSVVTNVEREHMDYFKTFENQLASFKQFKQQSSYVVEQDENYSVKNVRHDKSGRLSFSLYANQNKIFRLKMQIYEDINAQNCIFAYRVCKLLGLSDDEIKKGLERFKGVKTRFERMSCKMFENVVCDYSHHPTEIEKAIYSAKKIFNGKSIVVVFQPHTFSRTKDLLDDFVKVLKTVDVPILYKTYSAREEPSDGLSAKALAEVLEKENKNTKYAENFRALMKRFEELSKDAVILIVGAGDLPAILHKNKFLS